MSILRFGENNMVWSLNTKKRLFTGYDNRKNANRRNPIAGIRADEAMIAGAVYEMLKRGLAPSTPMKRETNKNVFTWSKEGIYRLNKTNNQLSKLSPSSNYTLKVLTNMVMKDAAV